MRWGRAAGALALVASVQACAPTRPAPPPVVDGQQRGIASWYGPGFHGRRTANGEVYDQYELTAAHRTLPLGTRVMVTSLANGRAVEVRINDRGPYVGGRVIDLSYAAARVLDMIGPGVMPVQVAVLDAPVRVAARRPTPLPPAPRAAASVADAPAPPAHRYFLLVATLSDPRKAEHLRSRLALKFPDAHVRPLDAGDARYHRVRVGPYASREAATARAALVTRYGYPAVLVQEPSP